MDLNKIYMQDEGGTGGDTPAAPAEEEKKEEGEMPAEGADEGSGDAQ